MCYKSGILAAVVQQKTVTFQRFCDPKSSILGMGNVASRLSFFEKKLSLCSALVFSFLPLAKSHEMQDR
jgi:hypothetical protein